MLLQPSHGFINLFQIEARRLADATTKHSIIYTKNFVRRPQKYNKHLIAVNVSVMVIS